MLRTAAGALDAVLGGSSLSKRIARDAVGKQLWTRRLSTNLAPLPWHQSVRLSQLWPRKSLAGNVKGTSKAGPLQTHFFSSARRPFHSSRARRSEGSSSSTNGKTGGKAAEPERLGFTARMRKLSREYGWAAVGVYAGLTVLDFPFCFLLVRTVGTDRIAQVEHVVVSWAEKVIPEGVKTFWREYREALRENRVRNGGEDLAVEGYGVKEAEERSKQEGASLATQLALAYAIHKSFIFIRVPLTAAITPKVVKVLRSWGWQIGKRRGGKR
ncbi:hypothetical protein B0T26DRAFT_698232 [Lasiosphaeria miniovina]|uniref:DUF1279 domain-containing protein n=1 Tax=Lasiosphaeria miniovina TaxID=1954250 RepID=A0AA40B6A6_9PEZI|nr:uncharacterized protein B0T26DRAFT_698232 [Lasiosphaeria miniovina]KAK0728504.1 hypothetical protein B0T26DRAFT_698232 [Lasiosphaeria miniovina]